MKQKGFAPVVILIVIAAFLVFGAYVAGNKGLLNNLPKISVSLPSPTPSYTPVPTIDPTAGWKTYTGAKIGYTLKAPSSWYSKQNEDDSLLKNQDYLSNLTLSPEKLDEGITMNTLIVPFPINISGPHKDVGKIFEKGLEGLAISDTSEPSSNFASRQVEYTTISGMRTLVIRKIWKEESPEGLVGGWCPGCGSKNYYLDLGNDKILQISAHWMKNQTTIEKMFDQIISTFKFTQ